MRIIARPQQKTEFESTCQECETRVALTPQDIRFVADMRDGNAVVWTCPTCTRENWVSTDLVPREIVAVVTR